MTKEAANRAMEFLMKTQNYARSMITPSAEAQALQFVGNARDFRELKNAYETTRK